MLDDVKHAQFLHTDAVKEVQSQYEQGLISALEFGLKIVQLWAEFD